MIELKEKIDWDKYIGAISSCQPIRLEGKIVKVVGIVAEANGPGLSVGSLCTIKNSDGHNIQAEVIGFNDKRVIIMPLSEMRGIEPGSKIIDMSKRPAVQVGEAYLGRIIDGIGCPIDGKGGGLIGHSGLGVRCADGAHEQSPWPERHNVALQN